MNTTTQQPDTIRLTSNSMVYTPGLFSMAIRQYTFNKAWSIKFLMDGYGLSKRCAVDLLTGKVNHEVIGEDVVFQYPVGKAKQEVAK